MSALGALVQQRRPAILRRDPATGQAVYPDPPSFGLQVRRVEDGQNTTPRVRLKAVKAAPSRPKALIPILNCLNETEIEILQWISLGKRYDEMAEILNTTHNALYQHCHRIYDKLGTQTSAGAVGIALRMGLIK